MNQRTSSVKRERVAGRRKAKVKFSPTEFKSFPQFSGLPENIQKRIFEHSLCLDTSTGPALALVSHEVNGWQVNKSAQDRTTDIRIYCD